MRRRNDTSSEDKLISKSERDEYVAKYGSPINENIEFISTALLMIFLLFATFVIIYFIQHS